MSANLLFSILIHYPLKKGKTTKLIPGKERSSEISRILMIVQFLSFGKMNPAIDCFAYFLSVYLFI